MIRVVVADDQRLVRLGVRALLQQSPDIRVLSEAQDGQEAIDVVLRDPPDVLVLDINMPRLDGIEVTRRINESGLPTQVLILSMYSDYSTVTRAFRCGACGYLLKKTVAQDLLPAIRVVSQRQRYIAPALERALSSLNEGAALPRDRSELT